MNSNELDLVFAALSDPTRRGMLEQLAGGQTNIAKLAEPYAMSQPAISKHIRVLDRAGLIHKTKQGRENIIRVETKTIKAATNWIRYYTRFWEQQFDAVDTYLKELEQKVD